MSRKRSRLEVGCRRLATVLAVIAGVFAGFLALVITLEQQGYARYRALRELEQQVRADMASEKGAPGEALDFSALKGADYLPEERARGVVAPERLRNAYEVLSRPEQLLLDPELGEEVAGHPVHLRHHYRVEVVPVGVQEVEEPGPLQRRPGDALVGIPGRNLQPLARGVVLYRVPLRVAAEAVLARLRARRYPDVGRHLPHSAPPFCNVNPNYRYGVVA